MRMINIKKLEVIMPNKNDVNYIRRLSDKELKNYICIGFCQPKFYIRSVWLKADRIMKILCKLDLAETYDFGRVRESIFQNLVIWDLQRLTDVKFLLLEHQIIMLEISLRK